ncbi:MAG: nitroreductase [Endomicrobia bacterium]|nr:nitroreductase [Endomicrobiia bacterium]
MKLLDIIKSRRSIRKYKDKPIPQEYLTQIIEAARWAPSGLNNQPWKFIIIQNRQTIAEIAKFTKYKYIVENAALLIVVLLDNDLSYDRTKDIQAIGACIQNMLLMCHYLGLGACWIGEILNRKKDVEKFLELKENLELMAVVTVGFPDESQKQSTRKSIDEIVIKKL